MLVKKILMSHALASCLIGSLLFASDSRADLIINEVLGSTTGADSEFIELYNSGATAVDISGWTISEYESDSGAASFGNLDDSWVISPATSIAAGGFYLLGNATFVTDFGITPDQAETLSIENSSYTLALTNTADELQYVAFVSDADGVANVAGDTSITPDVSVGPDGTFLPAGYYLTEDGGSTAALLEFSPKPAPSATPGSTNSAVAVPEPTSLVLAGLGGVGGLARFRRRRKVA